MQHATCNMQHATCNKNGNKLVSFLAALALTAAALATTPASAYGAYRIFALDGNSTYRNPSCPAILDPGANTCPQSNRFFVGVSFDEEQSNAETAALANCNTKRNALLNDGYTPATGVVCRTDPLSHNAFSDTFVNQCFAYAGQNGDPLADEISHGLGDDAAAARANALMNCRDHDGGGNACQLLDLATPAVNITTFANRADDADFTTAVCDHTCTAIETARNANTAGCDTCSDNMIANADNSACVAVQNSTDCGTRADLLNNEERFLIGGVCSVADSCDAEHSVPNGEGGCMECEATETEESNACVAIECDTNESIENRQCVCPATTHEEFNGNCVPVCVAPETRDTTNGNCVDMTDMTDDGNTDDGNTDDGNTDDGNTDDGNTDDGNTDDGNTDDGNTDDGGDTDNGGDNDNNMMNDDEDTLTSSPETAKESKNFTGVYVGAFIALLYLIANSEDAAAINWTPSYSFVSNNGNVSYSVGSRWTATEDNWRVYWQTNQNNGKFVYGSGIGYNNGILSAAMNSQSESDKTNMNLDLSANKTVGLWNLGGGYNFDMQLSETETETQNRLNAKVRYTMDKWILSANANTDGNMATARINYSYRF